MSKRATKAFENMCPSEIIRVAVQDLKEVEKLKSKYVVDMGRWHVPGGAFPWEEKPSLKCAVCFAGSVMARTLETQADKNRYPGNFKAAIANRLNALDSFREGYIQDGLGMMGVELPKLVECLVDIPVTEYANDPAQFKKEMLQLADGLEELGL